MSELSPLILWFRRDLRLDDNPMVARAAASGRPVLPVFILDPETDAIGAAPLWRLGLGLEAFAARLAAMGSRLILRRGRAAEVLAQLVAETGASGVHWGRYYEPGFIARDAAVKASLRAAGFEAESHEGMTLAEPWQVETAQGGWFKVYTPFWKALFARGVAAPYPAPERLVAPAVWPSSDRLEDWRLGAAMRRGAAVCLPFQRVGEGKALARLEDFLASHAGDYKAARDFPARDATSGLSENLAWGEIGPRRIWAAGFRAMEAGAAGAEHFLKELAWRDFAWHLLYHSPQIASSNWRTELDSFPWRADNDQAEAWRRGMTGEPFVDAGMREMYVTGKMHNRVRMVVASYLTKHLLTDWRVGQAWFADCLTDWDPASNAMGWQWVAGCGPDAAPYFRIFNPAGQAEKFDENRRYLRRWLAEAFRPPSDTALRYFDAVPRAWGLDPARAYPLPVVGLAEGRSRALAAYEQRKG